MSLQAFQMSSVDPRMDIDSTLGSVDEADLVAEWQPHQERSLALGVVLAAAATVAVVVLVDVVVLLAWAPAG